MPVSRPGSSEPGVHDAGLDVGADTSRPNRPGARGVAAAYPAANYADTVFLRYLKAQGFVLLCGGLVGPIFLVVFFLMGGDPLLKWMFWTGLLVTAADVLVALAIANSGAKSAATSQLLQRTGVLALAQVTSIAETGTRINEQPLVKIGLHIDGPGLTPFDAEDRVLASVTRLPLITGRKLVALVDPATNRYQIDWQRSALISGTVPAQFSLDDDGRTYDLSGRAGPLLEIMRVLAANDIPLTGTNDVRSHPAVRQQVMTIVRNAARQSDTPPQASSPTSFAQRLSELESLRTSGAISDAEYTAKRQQIIAEL